LTKTNNFATRDQRVARLQNLFVIFVRLVADDDYDLYISFLIRKDSYHFKTTDFDLPFSYKTDSIKFRGKTLQKMGSM
jgi:hypothetical protein